MKTFFVTESDSAEEIFFDNKKRWDNFLIENGGSFLQSWDWGDLEKKQKKRIWRIQIKNNENEIICEAQTQKEIFPFGKSMLYIPYGPCFKQNIFLKGKKKILNLILKEVKKIAKREKAFFLKIEPASSFPKIDEALKPQRRIQPKKNLILSLKKSEEELLKSFHQKTRYNIKIAEKRGLNVLAIKEKKEKIKYLKIFMRFVQKTSRRGNFKPHIKDHYMNILNLDNTVLYLGEYKNIFIATNIVLYFGKVATYLHGALDYKYRNIMAPHFLQWRQIIDAKNMGYEKYDFGGIDEKKWPGVTRFKMGFKGDILEYPQGGDFVFNKLLYKTYKTLRKIF